MPAIRNAILMILAHKTSQELLDRDGKEQLAARDHARGGAADGHRGRRRRRADDSAPSPARTSADAEDDAPAKARSKPKKKTHGRCTTRSSTCTSRNFIIQ